MYSQRQKKIEKAGRQDLMDMIARRSVNQDIINRKTMGGALERLSTD